MKKQELAHKKAIAILGYAKMGPKGKFVLVEGSAESKATEIEIQLGQSVS